MTTFAEVEASITNAGLAVSYRGTEKIVTLGCVVTVDSFGNVVIVEEAGHADRERLERIINTY